MDAIALYQDTCTRISKLLTRRYSTSFSMGAWLMSRRFQAHVYAIYGFVRLADEIVDSFHTSKKRALLEQLRSDTEEALRSRFSLNPLLHAFQQTVHKYDVDTELIDAFLNSMEMDLSLNRHDEASYTRYIHGSAEAVGLMCLKVFCEGEQSRYETLRPYAIALGAAFQKVNFLRDLRSDYVDRGRVYFPNLNVDEFKATEKASIEREIAEDFKTARQGISQLPRGTRLGVYLAYAYFYLLLRRIRKLPPERLLEHRPRLPNILKLLLVPLCCIRLHIGYL